VLVLTTSPESKKKLHAIQKLIAYFTPAAQLLTALRIGDVLLLDGSSRAIFPTLIAQALQSISYPILPII